MSYPIDYAQLNRSRQERAASKARHSARNQSVRRLGLWRRRDRSA